MRRARTPPRPPLARRAVVSFPQGPGAALVESFRSRHDPLARALPAHVTFVFPFASTLSALQVAAHVGKVAARWPPLPIRLDGVDAYTAEWVHLRVTRGRDSVVELHDRLHRRALAHFLRREFDYAPHVTIGRAADAAACDAMLGEARATFAHPVDLVVRSLHVLTLAADGAATREAEIGLGA
jgi:2'-5' RNA ligase